MAQQPTVEWITFEQASSKMKANPKKIIIDVYTDWCSWCKKMDQTTFSDPIIANYMIKNFYSVKFNAESKDTLIFGGKTFVNPTPNEKRSAHQFAKALLKGKLSYPSYVLMDEKFSIISIVPGYMTPDKFEPVLHYFNTESYKSTDWNEYNAAFKGSFKQQVKQ
jgi:thioredoxin-related protein